MVNASLQDYIKHNRSRLQTDLFDKMYRQAKGCEILPEAKEKEKCRKLISTKLRNFVKKGDVSNENLDQHADLFFVKREDNDYYF